jgi:hypothetical protein
VESIERLQGILIVRDSSVLIWSLGQLDYPLDKSPQLLQQLEEAMVREQDKIQTCDIAQAVSGLSAGGVSWDNLSPAMHW